MSFWTSETLKARLADLVEPADPSRVTNCRIELTVGGQYFHTGEKTRRELRAGEQVSIPPGEFALLVTQESVRIPASAIGLISIRTGVKFQGLVNVSGFHVDPGYHGPLVFGLLNAGHKPIIVEQGQPLFLLWLADLGEPGTEDVFRGSPKGITPAMVQNLHGSVPSIFDLGRRVEALETRSTLFLAFSGSAVVGVMALFLRFLLAGAVAPAAPAPASNSAIQSSVPSTAPAAAQVPSPSPSTPATPPSPSPAAPPPQNSPAASAAAPPAPSAPPSPSPAGSGP